MTTDKLLNRFGLTPKGQELDVVRDVLANEIEIEKQGGVREADLALLCCVQLFGNGSLGDVLLIWKAKNSGFDLGLYLDVRLLCGAGVKNTKTYLRSHPSEEAHGALGYIEKCELGGDFDGWSPQKQMEVYRNYFGVA